MKFGHPVVEKINMYKSLAKNNISLPQQGLLKVVSSYIMAFLYVKNYTIKIISKITQGN